MRVKVEMFECDQIPAAIEMKTQIDADPGTKPVITFHGRVGLNTPVGPQPVPFQIDAKTIEEAFNKYFATATEAGNAAQTKFEDHIAQMELEKKREEASAIVGPNGNIIGPDGTMKFPPRG
jgi:hypothetical protein